MQRELPYGMATRYIDINHMFYHYLMTSELCKILDCSRGFFIKNFRDLGLKFSELRGEKIQIRRDIISERGTDRAHEHSACYTDVFYAKSDVLNRILSESEITIQTDFLDLAQFFTGERASMMYVYIMEAQKKSRKPSEMARLSDEANRVIGDENNPLLRGIWFYDLAKLNAYRRDSCPRILAPEIFDSVRKELGLDCLFSAKHLAEFYDARSIESVHRRVVENAWARVKFSGRVWYIKQPTMQGRHVVKIPAKTMKIIQQKYVKLRQHS